MVPDEGRMGNVGQGEYKMLSRCCLWRVTAVLAVAIAAQPASAITCDSDIDGNGVVDVLDLMEVLAHWGPCAGCPADVNGDEVVDALDLLQVLGDRGPCL